MKTLVSLGAALVVMVAIAACASSGDAFVYGSEVMSATEIETYRTFLATADNPELQEGIVAHNELVDQRASEMGIVLMTRAVSRPSRDRNTASRQASTGSRLGRGAGSRTATTGMDQNDIDRAMREGFGGSGGGSQ